MNASASGTRQISAVSANAISAACGLEHTLGGGRVLHEFLWWTPWTAHELAAAVRAFARELFRRAARAERAFERADVGRVGVGGQIRVAAFAAGSQLQHLETPMSSLRRSGGVRRDRTGSR